MEYTFNIRFPDKSSIFREEDIERFEKRIGINWKIKSKYSKLFLVDLYCHEVLYGILPEEVIEAILEEESEQSVVGIKPSIPFQRYPLKGLWHKHYFSARFIPHNISNQLAKGRPEKIVSEVFDPKKPSETIRNLSDSVVYDSLEERQNSNKLTGEWLIFAKHEGENYFLCMGAHNEDQMIRDKIELLCCQEFPFLNNILVAK